jgi:hypothetical protein
VFRAKQQPASESFRAREDRRIVHCLAGKVGSAAGNGVGDADPLSYGTGIAGSSLGRPISLMGQGTLGLGTCCELETSVLNPQELLQGHMTGHFT